MLNAYKIFSLILMVFFQHHLSAAPRFPDDLEKRIKYFNESCNDEDLKKIYKNKTRPNRLLLIDATDPLNRGQIQYLRDNYINGIDWQNKGEYFSMVLLDGEDISKLTQVTLCSPLKPDQISWTMAVKKERKIIRAYKKTLNEAFDFLVNQKTVANSTRLIETLYQIYTNKRFNFTKGERSLLIASDLMQISKEVDLRCKNNCPTFNETKSNKKAWFNITKLGLTNMDIVELYYFQTKCTVNLETLRWWQEYFIHEGISTENLFAKAENGVSDIPCGGERSNRTTNQTKKPGPIFKHPLNGESGFTKKFTSIR